jgi:hypothetical protein
LKSIIVDGAKACPIYNIDSGDGLVLRLSMERRGRGA